MPLTRKWHSRSQNYLGPNWHNPTSGIFQNKRCLGAVSSDTSELSNAFANLGNFCFKPPGKSGSAVLSPWCFPTIHLGNQGLHLLWVVFMPPEQSYISYCLSILRSNSLGQWLRLGSQFY